MGRPPRIAPAGEIFHVVNRGNDKQSIFTQDADRERFLHLLDESRAHADVTIVAYCLMSTHFHLVLRPNTDDALSEYMQRVEGCYACYFRKTTGTVGWGHLFKDRFWSDGIADYLKLLTVISYVEGNALAAGLVKRAEAWRWGSLRERCAPAPQLIDPAAVQLPPDWPGCVNLSRDRRLQEIMRRLMCFRRRRR